MAPVLRQHRYFSGVVPIFHLKLVILKSPLGVVHLFTFHRSLVRHVAFVAISYPYWRCVNLIYGVIPSSNRKHDIYVVCYL